MLFVRPFLSLAAAPSYIGSQIVRRPPELPVNGTYLRMRTSVTSYKCR